MSGFGVGPRHRSESRGSGNRGARPEGSRHDGESATTVDCERGCGILDVSH